MHRHFDYYEGQCRCGAWKEDDEESDDSVDVFSDSDSDASDVIEGI